MSISGVLNIYKPEKLSSHDVVQEVRRIIKRQLPEEKVKVGHSGTLDPFATGVLLVAVGKATRLIEYSHEWMKDYRMVIELGVTSDTDDITGALKAGNKDKASKLIRAEVEKSVHKFIGKQEQRPPEYSAKKVKGERSYMLAREGKAKTLPNQSVVISDIVIKEWCYPLLTIDATCSTGTYMRSLARDIGHDLGVGALARELKRTRVGRHSLNESINLKEIEEEGIESFIMNDAVLIEELPAVTLSEDNVAKFIRGMEIGETKLVKPFDSRSANCKGDDLTDDKICWVQCAVFDNNSSLLGTALLDTNEDLLRPKKVLHW